MALNKQKFNVVIANDEQVLIIQLIFVKIDISNCTFRQSLIFSEKYCYFSSVQELII